MNHQRMKYVGIYIDYKYTAWDELRKVVEQYDPDKYAVTMLEQGKTNSNVQRLLRIYGFKYYEMPTPEWEEANPMDEPWLYFLLLNKAPLHIFPHQFNLKTYGPNFSKRVQDLQIKAHLLKVNYEIHKEPT